ncbi:iron complex outermembrane receptor protein [Tibeticola sediminis]|uniref:Iron complex outermembrane receptor protein n=1 Tax=Tibeticola sediminis TaxID=1917811 RepID=A0A3N4TYX3_9BURK|nr:TonB-dependent receptor [Tibeticola sediminis]RPE63018.1 iron complex outermembrane receptor protein [Tibeticola sediminis]
MPLKPRRFRLQPLTHSVLLACGTMALAATPALAQTANTELQRVEITGSSIKRIAAEGALPVMVMKAEDIKATGATSVADLIQKISTVQGGSVESGAVGGESHGFTGISLHNIGETRTLVLLNGKRMAQFGGQTLTGFGAGFDVNALPISAIERVEILTDGASALYGADAIAGVVNFITKHDVTEGDVTIGFSNPKGGAREKRVSASKGFGSKEKDGFNVFMSFGHDERTQLNATARDFAKTGNIQFDYEGQRYQTQKYSSRNIPANVVNAGRLVSPYYLKNGTCPPGSFLVTDTQFCGYDYIAALEIYPERKRDSFMVSAVKPIGDHELYADVLLSRTQQISRIAPVPGEVGIPTGSALYNEYLTPLGMTGKATARYRFTDLGKRTNDDKADFQHLVVGSRGTLAGWDYDASLLHSQSDVKGNISGYPGSLAVDRLVKSGLLNPFVGPGQQTAAAQAAIDGVNYRGYWDGGTAKLTALNLNGSRPVGKLDGGPIMLGAGVNFNREEFASKPSPFAQGILSDPVKGTRCDPAAGDCDQRFGDAAAKPPYSASRNSKGVFGELQLPVSKKLEFGLAARYDNYSDFGDATTAKASFRWTPMPNLLVRGSLGTGFHAPTVPQVKGALQSYGVTGGTYICTPELLAIANSLGAQCQPGKGQYDVYAGGNPEIKPEKSRQATIGIRFEPNNQLSLGADLWHVAIRDAFGQLPEAAFFTNPNQYRSLFSTATDPGTGNKYLAIVQANGNLGKSYTTGIDFDIVGKAKTGWGDLNSQLTLTYMLRDEAQIEKGGKYYTGLGRFDDDLGTVTFRYKGRWANTLKTGNFAHTLAINFQSGYTDGTTTVDVLDAMGNVVDSKDLRIKVPAYVTFDWQTTWTFDKKWSVTGGVLNLTDRKPPLSISDIGYNRGQPRGYDDRYYDPRGRTFYVNASYKF